MCLVLACSARLDAATFEDMVVSCEQLRKKENVVCLSNYYLYILAHKISLFAELLDFCTLILDSFRWERSHRARRRISTVAKRVICYFSTISGWVTTSKYRIWRLPIKLIFAANKSLTADSEASALLGSKWMEEVVWLLLSGALFFSTYFITTHLYTQRNYTVFFQNLIIAQSSAAAANSFLGTQAGFDSDNDDTRSFLKKASIY